jgi:hypothetical protein
MDDFVKVTAELVMFAGIMTTIISTVLAIFGYLGLKKAGVIATTGLSILLAGTLKSNNPELSWWIAGGTGGVLEAIVLYFAMRRR